MQFTLNDTLLAVPGAPLNGTTCIPGKGVQYTMLMSVATSCNNIHWVCTLVMGGGFDTTLRGTCVCPSS